MNRRALLRIISTAFLVPLVTRLPAALLPEPMRTIRLTWNGGTPGTVVEYQDAPLSVRRETLDFGQGVTCLIEPL